MGNKSFDDLLELDEGYKSVVDPHHNGANEWMYKNNQFYHRPNGGTWHCVKKVHPTPERIRALYSLLPKKKKGNVITYILNYLLKLAERWTKN